MSLAVAFNGDEALIPHLSHYNVRSIYGKLTKDLVGGGRASFTLPQITNQMLRSAIETASKHQIAFTYLLNASCMGNREYTRKFNHKLVPFVDNLCNLGVSGIVVASPYLLDLLKNRYPQLRVSISTIAVIDSLYKAKHWCDRGADNLILSPTINRNLSLIKEIRKAVSCELELFANVGCIYKCPYQFDHSNASAHASQSVDKNEQFTIGYDVYHCAKRRLHEPAEMVMSQFIRPEDLSYYEDLGINTFKLIDRQKSSNWLLNTTKAYSEKSYEGNLCDIIPYPLIKSKEDQFALNPSSIKPLLQPKHINMNFLQTQRELSFSQFYFDNNQLDDFLQHFKDGKCVDAECGDQCRFCFDISKKAISFNKEEVTQNLAVLNTLKKQLIDGSAHKRNSPIATAITALAKLLIPNKNRFNS